MRTIHKHKVSLTGQLQQIRLPRGSVFLSAQPQYGVPQSWWLVDENAELETRTFMVMVTGGHLDDGVVVAFLGTFQLSGGDFVGHLFEVFPQ